MVIRAADPRGTKLLQESVIYDCHVHLGKDKDGFSLRLPTILAAMRAARVMRFVLFPFDDLDGGQSFHRANESVLKAAQSTPQIIPFMRLDPLGPWEREAKLRATQGFRGIKLHPRAQKFSLVCAQAKRVYAFAQDHQLPILIHTGLGMSGITKQVQKIALAYPDLRLILGHAGFVDLPGICKLLGSSKARHIYAETSTLRVYDLYELLKNAPSSRIIFGSDIPYADLNVGLEALVDVALMVGLSESSVRAILSDNLTRCLEGR